jgi:hypothetical protein
MENKFTQNFLHEYGFRLSIQFSLHHNFYEKPSFHCHIHILVLRKSIPGCFAGDAAVRVQ